MIKVYFDKKLVMTVKNDALYKKLHPAIAVIAMTENKKLTDSEDKK